MGWWLETPPFYKLLGSIAILVAFCILRIVYLLLKIRLWGASASAGLFYRRRNIGTSSPNTLQQQLQQPCKTIIVMGSGGHSSEMIRLLKKLDKDEFQPRQYIVAQTDNMSKLKIEEYERKGVGEGDANNQNFRIFSIPRSREVHQSYISTVFSTLKALRVSMSIIKRELPDLIICNGPGTCVPICLSAFILRLVFTKHIKIVFVESFARVKNLSLTGKILYFISDVFIVQWEGLTARYPRAKHLGGRIV